MTSLKNCREFVLYFEELDKLKIGYNLRDMMKKAEELDLPQPILDKNLKVIGWITREELLDKHLEVTEKQKGCAEKNY